LKEFYTCLVVLIPLIASSCGFLSGLRRERDDSGELSSGVSGESLGDRGPASFEESNTTRDRVNEDISASQGEARDVLSSSTAAVVEPERKRLYKHGERASADDFIDQSQEEGSLWASSGQTNYYFTKNKIRNPGDIISLKIEKDIYQEIGTEIKKTLTPKEKSVEIDLLRKKYIAKLLSGTTGSASKSDQITTTAAAPVPPQTGSPDKNANPAEVDSSDQTDSVNALRLSSQTGAPLTTAELEAKIPKFKMNDVDIYHSIQLKQGDTMMGEILERFPNGNYRIRTVKRIPYKQGSSRLVSVLGIVKSADISEDTDVINSGKVYDYRVEIAH